MRVDSKDVSDSLPGDSGRVSPIQASFDEPGPSTSRSPSIVASIISRTNEEDTVSQNADEDISQELDLPNEAPFEHDAHLVSQSDVAGVNLNGDDHSNGIPPQALPRASEDIPTVWHSRQSSVARSGTLGHHSRFSTTQLPTNRERIRYSWQSASQGEGSKKPRVQVIKCVSVTASASSAAPQGEALSYSISPSGRRIAAYNSSRLYVLQTAVLPLNIGSEYSIKRRPLALALNDSADLVAILADAHTVNVYDLSYTKTRRLKTIKLDFPARCIAIAPCGGLLATAYEGGIEVFSLAKDSLPTDRRAVRSAQMDRLTFSEDGSTLLGTTSRANATASVIVNVPVFPAASNGTPTPDELKIAWCSDLLHPEKIKNSSHATFLREDRTTCNEKVFAWNNMRDAFGVFHTSDMQYGHEEFPIHRNPPLSMCGGLGAAVHSCPSIDEYGETAAIVVNNRTIRLHKVPHNTLEDDTPFEAHTLDHEFDEGYGNPFTDISWFHSEKKTSLTPPGIDGVKGKLIAISPGSLPEQQDEDSFRDVESGRIILLDFDPHYSGSSPLYHTLYLGKSPPVPLEEEEVDVDSAVAIVRRRTVKQNNAADMTHRPATLGRAVTTIGTRNVPRPGSAAILSRRGPSVLSVGSAMSSEAARSLPDLAEGGEQIEALEEPFSMTAPRSHASLQRAATNVQRHRVQAMEERDQVRNNASHDDFLPLPEYTEEPNAPLPSRFRAMAGLDLTAPPPLRPASIAIGPAPRAFSAGTVPLSAPPVSFSAEQAFAAANANVSARNGTPPLSMPRSLIRAYSTAANNIQHNQDYHFMNGTTTTREPVLRSPTVDLVSPQDSMAPSVHGSVSPGLPTPRSFVNRAPDHRMSTPLASMTESMTGSPRRSASTRRPGEHVIGSSRQYSQQNSRQAASTASLFPPAQPADMVPLPGTARGQSAGAVAHPVTGWRPPVAPVLSSRTGSVNRGHGRKSSLADKSAFASTQKAKKMGWFKKGRAMKSSRPGTGGSAPVMDDGKSMVTWVTNSDKKCAVM